MPLRYQVDFSSWRKRECNYDTSLRKVHEFSLTLSFGIDMLPMASQGEGIPHILCGIRSWAAQTPQNCSQKTFSNHRDFFSYLPRFAEPVLHPVGVL